MSLLQDLRVAFRSLRRTPSTTGIALSSLALAIGGNLLVFALINGIFFRPLPFEKPEELSLIAANQVGGTPGDLLPASAAELLDLQQRQSVFTEIAGVRLEVRRLGTGSEAEQLGGARVSPGFFPLLGVDAALGRTFLPEEGRGRAARVAVLSHPAWVGRLAADPDVLGRSLSIDGEVHTVVGILPEGFDYFDPDLAIWTPLALDPATPRDQRDMYGVGRLRPGVSMDEARSQMAAIALQLAEESPEIDHGRTIDLANMRTDMPHPRSRRLSALLQGALLFLLLIACINLTNLLIARGLVRQQEIALRRALGASGRRVFGLLLTENVLLAVLGGLAGLVLGMVGVEVLASVLAPSMPSFWVPVVDLRVVLFAVAVTAASALLFGLLPLLSLLKSDLVGALKSGGRGSSAGRSRRWIQKALVVSELSLALALLGGGAILVRSFLETQKSDPGFATDSLLVASLAPPADGGAGASLSPERLSRLGEHLAALPGVVAATLSSGRPRDPSHAAEPFEVEGRPTPEGQPLPRATSLAVLPSYFETLGIALQQGRAFTSLDHREAEPVAIVNRALAERFWPRENPLGRWISIAGERRRVVGVVTTVSHGFLPSESRNWAVYLPLAQKPTHRLFATLRAATEPEALATDFRHRVAEIEPELVVSKIQTVDELLAETFAGAEIVGAILGGFGLLALLLAALGVFGVLSHAVAQRRHEIGVRMAVGARRSQIMRMILHQGLGYATAGLAIGTLLVLAISRLIASTIAELMPVRPSTALLAALVLLAVSLLASLMPARRAARVEPIQTLRID